MNKKVMLLQLDAIADDMKHYDTKDAINIMFLIARALAELLPEADLKPLVPKKGRKKAA
jgi:hypothetical protein